MKQIKVLTVTEWGASIVGFAGAERKFFEKGIRTDRKPVPVWVHISTQTDVD